jgi:hypothetical protein
MILAAGAGTAGAGDGEASISPPDGKTGEAAGTTAGRARRARELLMSEMTTPMEGPYRETPCESAQGAPACSVHAKGSCWEQQRAVLKRTFEWAAWISAILCRFRTRCWMQGVSRPRRLASPRLAPPSGRAQPAVRSGQSGRSPRVRRGSVPRGSRQGTGTTATVSLVGPRHPPGLRPRPRRLPGAGPGVGRCGRATPLLRGR